MTKEEYFGGWITVLPTKEMQEAINNLKSRYKRIYVSFDTDSPGILNTKRLAERTGFIPVIPDLKESKDYSDYYKALQDKQEFKKLEVLFK